MIKNNPVITLATRKFPLRLEAIENPLQHNMYRCFQCSNHPVKEIPSFKGLSHSILDSQQDVCQVANEIYAHLQVLAGR